MTSPTHGEQQTQLHVSCTIEAQPNGQLAARLTQAVGPISASLLFPVEHIAALRDLYVQVFDAAEKQLQRATSGLVLPGDPRMQPPPGVNGGRPVVR